MAEKPEIVPYLTNHFLKATTVTVLSGSNRETREIKTITGHKCESSIESYVKRLTLDQFKKMSTALTSFINSEESPVLARSRSNELVLKGPSTSSSSTSIQVQQQHWHAGSASVVLKLAWFAASGAILLSGSINNRTLTFNINMNTNSPLSRSQLSASFEFSFLNYCTTVKTFDQQSTVKILTRLPHDTWLWRVPRMFTSASMISRFCRVFSWILIK